MRMNTNRLLAWCVLGACVFTAVFALGGLQLHRSRENVMDVFYGSTDPAEAGVGSMHSLLNRAAASAQAMAVEALCYLGADYAIAKDVLACAALLGADMHLNDRSAAYMRLQHEVDALYNAMYTRNLLDGERAAFKRAYDDFWRCDRGIRRDPYREMAEEYNCSMETFPARLVAAAAGAEKLNTFGA